MTAVRHVTRPRALVVGSGIAGLTAALELGDCTVVTRSELGAGSSRWAQGGIAAAFGRGDTPSHHAADTIAVSGGLVVPEIADLITAAAPDRVRWLHGLGAVFDLDADGRFSLGREAGHSDRRIVHAGGDATGAAAMRALIDAVRARNDIEVVEHRQAIDVIQSAGVAVGVTVIDPRGHVEALLADAVVLATGGIGRVYSRTTNPPESTGDGLAMALRAGARIRDPEFVQFHPTALDTTGDPLPLLTEALRGEGAVLLDTDGRRFMVDVHPDAELAPRDVVARANWEARRRGPIHLDARTITDDFPARFPTVFAATIAAGIDPRDTAIPITPAQHYHVGGIDTDAHGRTTVPGLFACGEAASLGLHGANRLASNSLVEGLVMGARVAAAIAGGAPAPPRDGFEVPAWQPVSGVLPDHQAVADLRGTMWEHGGLVRDAEGLATAIDAVGELRGQLATSVTGRNLADVADVLLRAALDRRESRGGHFRADHPETLPGPGRHTIVQRAPGRQRRLEILADTRMVAS